MRHPLVSITAALAATACAACGGAAAPAGARPLPTGSEPVTLDPAEFTTRIDNPYLPLRPGSRWVYRETAPGAVPQRVVVTVTRQTATIAGITARVVRDVATERGRVVESTRDWYAQDREGNVWYLGEATTEYGPGRAPSTAGSWRTGVGGAQAGIAMPARPRAGLAYRQEYLAGEAEDRAQVVSGREQAQVPAGHYAPALLTRETTPLTPRSLEYKLYAKGVGVVLALGVSGSSSREELVSFRPGR